MASSAALTTTHLPHLRSLLKEWAESQGPSKSFTTALQDITNRERVLKEGLLKDVIVAFRTRPPLEQEAESKFHANTNEEGLAGDLTASDAQGDPVTFCTGISVTGAEPGVFVAHVPGMKWSGPTLSHKAYDADIAFGPRIDNEVVDQRTVVANDLLPLVLSGGIACILAYGQTGSGKTFTMEGLEHRVARDLFDTGRHIGRRLWVIEQGKPTSGGIQPTGNGEDILELLGKQAVDLVEPSKETQGNPARREIAIREDKVGNVRPNLISTAVHSSTELEYLITKALSHRRTSATLRNATSSRSHALLTIRIKNKLLPYAEEGQLILVDLAGSERYEDSKEHDKQRMQESQDNNKSLMNLKECVRAKAKMAQEDGFVHIPWRSNKLTMLLKPIFDIESRQPSRILIIAHVSPHIQDTVHSANTLSYASPFKTAPPKLRGPAPYDPTDPRTWGTDETRAWLLAEFTRHAKARTSVQNENKGITKGQSDPTTNEELQLAVDVNKLCPPGATGRNFGNIYTMEFVEKCLQARPDTVGEKGFIVDTETTKKIAMKAIGNLFYLVLTAKTKKRNDVMKSRKGIDIESYGEAPIRYVPGTNRIYETIIYDAGEIVDARTDIGDKWDKTIDAAVKKAADEDMDIPEARDIAIKGMMNAWRAEVRREKEQLVDRLRKTED